MKAGSGSLGVTKRMRVSYGGSAALDPTDRRLLLKVTAPRVPVGLVERTGTTMESARLHDRQVVAVVAPAGFGKTALLCQWRRALLRRGAIVAWLSADDADEPARFTKAIALAMERAGGWRSFARIRDQQASNPADVDRLTDWLTEIAELACDTVLIVDEVDRLPGRTLEGSLSYVLANLAPNLRVVCAARRPVLRLADQTAHGIATQLSAEDLRFSLQETIRLLQHRFGAKADLDEAARIHELAHGWPLGIQLAIASMDGRAHSSERPSARPSSSHRDFKHLLLESLLSHLTRVERRFLVRASIVERVNGSLCEALTGRADSARVLARLRETTPLFSESLEGGWLTIHPMAREALGGEFARWPARVRRSVHAAAARWLEAHRLEEEAARHALQAGQRERAWRLAERSLFAALARGHVVRTREWFERTPLPKRSLRPPLLLAAGWSSAISGIPKEARASAQRVLRDRRSTHDERVLARLLLSAAEIYADRIDRAEKLVEAWSRDGAGLRVKAAFNGRNQTAMIALFQGRPAQARRILKEARRAMHDGESGLVLVFNWAVEGMSYLWEGYVRSAVEVLTRALHAAERTVGHRGVPALTLAGLSAFALWECGELEEASTVLLNRLDAIEEFATPSGLAAGFLAASRLALHRGEEGRACELLEDLCAIGESREMPRVQVLPLTELIRLHGAHGRSETCAMLLRRLDRVFEAASDLSGSFKDLLLLHRGIAAAHTARAGGDWPAVLERLEAAGQQADRLHRGIDGLEIRLLRAEATHACGRDARALLAEAYGRAGSLGCKRLRSEPYVQALCRAILPEEPDEPIEPPGAVDPGSPLPAHRSARKESARIAPAAFLTPKEREVLELMARRLSNKQIATALDVGPTTVKWHLKNLFAKLHAAGREHAIQRAQMLGILTLH